MTLGLQPVLVLTSPSGISILAGDRAVQSLGVSWPGSGGCLLLVSIKLLWILRKNNPLRRSIRSDSWQTTAGTCGEEVQTRNKGRLDWASPRAEPSPPPRTSPLQVISSFSGPFPLSRSPSFHSDSPTSPYPRSGSLWVICFQSSHLGLRCNLLGLKGGASSLNSEAWPELGCPQKHPTYWSSIQACGENSPSGTVCYIWQLTNTPGGPAHPDGVWNSSVHPSGYL